MSLMMPTEAVSLFQVYQSGEYLLSYDTHQWLKNSPLLWNELSACNKTNFPLLWYLLDCCALIRRV